MAVDIYTLKIQALPLGELRTRFDDWTLVREEYLELVRKQREFTVAESDRIEAGFLQIETTLMMSEAKRWFRAAEAPILTYQLSPPGHPGQSRVMLAAHEQFREIEFGDYDGEFILETDLDAEGLPHVSDEFWEHVVALSKFEGFRFTENSWINDPPERAKAMHRSGRSQIYKLIRNYTTHRLLDRDVQDLGSLEVRWPIQTDWATFVEEFGAAFSSLVKINNALFRVQYQRQRQISKKAARYRDSL